MSRDDENQDETSASVRHVFRWDLDKTYLRTDFDTWRDLVRTALQKPEERANVPGAVSLLRELTRPSKRGRAVVTFISGSPEQMRRKLESKFAIDGIHPDAFVLKPQLRYLMRGRFRAIRGQVGYKIEALLRMRAQTAIAPETLFGDDAEQDAFIYSLYADVVSEALSTAELGRILDAARVYADTRDLILERAERTPKADNVGRIFINLDRRSASGRFLPFGPRVVPVTNYFQSAIVLYDEGILSPRGLVRVAADLVSETGSGIAQLANSYQDLGRRGVVGASVVRRLEAARAPIEALAGVPEEFARSLIASMRALAPRTEAPSSSWSGPPDYVAILETDRELRRAVTETSDARTAIANIFGGG